MSEPKFVKRESPRRPEVINTHSIISHRTGRGIVVVEWNNEEGQFDPEDARKFAHEILREADNAETDVFLYQFFKDKLELDPHRLAQFITDFRNDRARREQAAGLRRTGQPVPEDDAR